MRRAGFTLMELMLTIVVIGLITMVAVPKVGRMIQRARVNRAATVVAGDLQQAVTIAARQRKPVRLTCVCNLGRYTVADRTGGTVRLNRVLAGSDEYGVTSLAFDRTQVDIFPSGITSGGDLRVTIGAAGHSRTVLLTSAGFVRILPS